MQLGDIHITQEFTLSKAESIQFAQIWDPQSFHIDELAAAASNFSRLVGSGLQSLCLIVKLGVEDGFLAENCLGGLGIDGLRFVSPLLPDQSYRARFEVISLRQTTRKVGRLVITLACQLLDPEDGVVLTCQITNLYLDR